MSQGNRIRLLCVVLVIAGVALVTMLGGPKAEVAYHVTSPDKKVEIRMPDETIPLDVEILDIAMVPVPGGYALRPEGLTLNGEVTISFALPMNDGVVTVPKFILHTDDKDYEPIDIRIRRHHSLGTAVVEIDTENFRWIEFF